MTATATETNFADLPEEIIRLILLKLAVKVLMVCRCVSTQWLRIISDRSFCNFHTQQQRASLTRRILISTAAEGLQSLDLNDPAQDRAIRCPFKKPDSSKITILSTCNGLVFASDWMKFYVWNPSTGFFRQLPCLLEHSQAHTFRLDHYGFGYISESDDYKVFVDITPHFDLVKERNHLVYVFSWRSKTWTMIESSPYNPWLTQIPRRYSVFVNNKLHWFDDVHAQKPDKYISSLREDEDVRGPGILTFDLVRHEFSKIQLPPKFDYIDRWYDRFYKTRFGVWRGQSLYILRYVKGHLESAVLWFINEYGVDKCWASFAVNLSNPPERVILRSLVVEGRNTNLISIDLKQDDIDNIIHVHPGKSNYIVYQETLLVPERLVRPNLMFYKNIKRRSLKRKRRSLK